jgi:hypothetical protein
MLVMKRLSCWLVAATAVFMTCFIGMSAVASAAQAEDDSTNMLIVPISQSVTSSPADEVTENEELEIHLDPSEISAIEDLHFNRDQFVNSSREEMSKELSGEQIQIPQGPGTEAELDKVLKMSDQEIAIFLGRKEKFLSKFARALAFFRMKPAKINKALGDLNRRLYESSNVIARSNTKGGTLAVSLSTGFALPQKIMRALRQRNIGNFIPDSGGFHYLMDLGVGFSRTINANGKSKFVLDIYFDVQRLKSSLTGVIDASASVLYGVTFEDRHGNFAQQDAELLTGGLAGIIRQGDKQFAWSGLLGVSIPPGIGAVIFYQSSATRFYLFRAEGLKILFPALQLIKENIITNLKNIIANKGIAVRCESLFAD